MRDAATNRHVYQYYVHQWSSQFIRMVLWSLILIIKQHVDLRILLRYIIIVQHIKWCVKCPNVCKTNCLFPYCYCKVYWSLYAVLRKPIALAWLYHCSKQHESFYIKQNKSIKRFVIYVIINKNRYLTLASIMPYIGTLILNGIYQSTWGFGKLYCKFYLYTSEQLSCRS